jgi:Flp pilus assembly protein TadD
VRIVAFRNEKEYRPYAPNEAATAFYATDLDHDFIVMSEIGADRYPAAVHEYVHLIIRHAGLTLPLWANEGLANVFSTLRPMGKKVVFGDPIPGYLMEARSQPLLDLGTLITVGHESRDYNERTRAGIFYSESWALMHMLYVSPEYRPKISVFLKVLADGGGTEAALREAWGKSLVDVQKDLHAYIQGDNFHSLVASIQLDKQAEAPEVRPMSAWDANLVLAEIQSSTPRGADAARKMLEQLTAEQPRRPEPPAVLAELELREGHGDQAVRLFAKAAELGSTDPEMYFRYAMLLWNHSGARDEALVKALQKAVELRPDYPEARMRLGFALMDHGDYKQALVELKQVKIVKPEDAFPYFHALAFSSQIVGDEKDARAALELAKKWAKEPSDKVAAEQLSQAINAATPASSATESQNVPEPATAQTGTVEAVTPASGLLRMEGTLDTIECNGQSARLAIVSNGATVWFMVDNPASVRMTNTGEGAVDFTCGKQTGRRVAIEYQDRPNGETKTIGVVRGIDFQ